MDGDITANQTRLYALVCTDKSKDFFCKGRTGRQVVEQVASDDMKAAIPHLNDKEAREFSAQIEDPRPNTFETCSTPHHHRPTTTATPRSKQKQNQKWLG